MTKHVSLKTFLPKEELQTYLQLVPSGQTPLWKFWPDYVSRQITFEKSSATTRSVRDALRMIVRDCFICTLEKCNNRDIIENALLDLKEERGFGPTTYNSYLKNIKSYLIFLRKKKIIQKVDLDGVEKFPNRIGDQFVPKDEQIQQVIARITMRRQTTLERLRNIFFYQLLILTGARPSELELLTLDSIRRGKSQWMIVIQGTKNKPRKRYYYMTSNVKDAYIAYMQYRQTLRRTENNLFISQSKRTGWTKRGMQGLFKKLSKELGFTVGLYSTRRYVATKLATSGSSLQEIGDHLGHSRPSTTKRYIQQSGELTRKNVNIMSKLFINKDEL